MFEPNLRDERYLPFEGAGAISEWRLELPKEFRQFDYDTISDVVLHIRYTARESGGLLKQQVTSELETAINEVALAEGERGLANLFSARHEFPSEWHRFLHAADGQQLNLPLEGRFPYVFHDRTIQVNRVDLLVRLSEDFVDADSGGTKFTLAHPDAPTEFTLPNAPNLGGTLHASEEVDSEPGEWTLTVTGVAPDLADESGRLNPDAVEDIGVVVRYTAA